MKFLLMLLLASLAIGCTSPLQPEVAENSREIERLKREVEESRDNVAGAVETGFLMAEFQVEGTDYWDIPFDGAGPDFAYAYHRKNEAYMWEPILNYNVSYDAFDSYIRIWGDDLIGEEFMIISFRVQRESEIGVE